MSDLRRCLIKSIITPGDFWMTKYFDDKNEIEELEAKLGKEIRCSKYARYASFKGEGIEKDEVVAVQHPCFKDVYLRGKVKDILLKNGRYAYEVFLIDHGVRIDVNKDKIEIITNASIRNKDPAAFKVHLYGVQPIQPSETEILNFGKTGFKWEASKTWVPSAVKFVEKQLEKYDEIYINCRSIVRNTIIADIYLRESMSGSSKMSLADLLVGNKLAIKKEGVSLTSSKAAPSSSDGGLSVNAIPADLIEIRNIQAKLELVKKWRMEHASLESASKSELDDTWSDENDPHSSSLEKKVDQKPGRSRAANLIERLRKEKLNISSTPSSNNFNSASSNSTASSPNSCPKVSSRSYELFKKFSERRSILKPSNSQSDGSDEFVENPKIKVVMNRSGDFYEDDEDGFSFEEPMPIIPTIEETLESVLPDSCKEKTSSTHGVKLVPAGRNDPALPKEIKKGKVILKTPSLKESQVQDDDPWIISSENLVEPQDKFRNIPFGKEIQKNLDKENFETTLPVQRWSIPSIRRGENVVMIAPAKSGKTLSYILPIIDSAVDEELEGCQVYAIIVTSSAKKVRFIHSMCQSFLNESMEDKIKILAVHEENFNYIKTFSCHILIISENVFLNVMGNPEFDLQKLNYLVLDDADKILNPMPIVELILKQIGYKLLKVQSTMILACRQWTADIYDIIEKVQKKFVYFIFSNVELAIFNQIICRVLCSSKEVPKIDLLQSELRKVLHQKKMLIMCKDRSEIFQLIELLKTIGQMPLVVHEGLSKRNLSDIQMGWKYSKPNSALVLLCTFENFNDIKIEDTDVLIYYSLPLSLKQFNDTLACYKRNFEKSSHPKVQKQLVDEESFFIVLVDQFNEILPKILKFAQRLGAKIPQGLLSKCDELFAEVDHSIDTEVNRSFGSKSYRSAGFESHLSAGSKSYRSMGAKSDNFKTCRDDRPVSAKDSHFAPSRNDQKDVIMICPKFLEIGECPEISECSYRHFFSRDLDSVNLPSKGKVIFKIVEVTSFNSFWALLLEQEEVSVKGMKRLENKSTEITSQLADFFKSEKNRLPLKLFKLGDLCGVKCSLGLFHRAQIVQRDRRNKDEVVVRRIDEGDLLTVNVDEIYKLPSKVLQYPPQTIKICLGNLSPICQKTEESALFYIRDLVSRSTEENQVWTGRIVFSVNNILWLEEIKVLSVKDLIITEVFLKKDFIEKNWVVENKKHLKNLYKLADEAGIFNAKLKDEKSKSKDDVENHKKVKGKTESEAFVSVKPKEVAEVSKKLEVEPIDRNLELEWACFEEPFTQVQFLRAENTSLLFLRNAKFKKKLLELENECQNLIENSSRDGSSLREGDYCLAKAKNKRRWRRARIESMTPEGIDVFFLDYADFQYVQPKDVIPIPYDLLKKLPIQAVECSLIGIKHSRSCDIEVLNEIYNFSNGGKDELIAYKAFGNLKPKILGDQKYDVNLLSLEGKSLNKLLIENSSVTAIKSELCFVKNADEILDDKEDEPLITR